MAVTRWSFVGVHLFVMKLLIVSMVADQLQAGQCATAQLESNSMALIVSVRMMEKPVLDQS